MTALLIYCECTNT